jgi:hypothetical protein
VRASQQGRSGLAKGRAVGEGGGSSSVGAGDRELSYRNNGCTYTRTYLHVHPRLFLVGVRWRVGSGKWQWRGCKARRGCKALARDAHETATLCNEGGTLESNKGVKFVTASQHSQFVFNVGPTCCGIRFWQASAGREWKITQE